VALHAQGFDAVSVVRNYFGNRDGIVMRHSPFRTEAAFLPANRLTQFFAQEDK
jgi:hypothetical protein